MNEPKIVSGNQLRPGQYGIVVSRSNPAAPAKGTILHSESLWRAECTVIPLHQKPSQLVHSRNALPGQYRMVGPADDNAAGVFHHYNGVAVTKEPDGTLRLDECNSPMVFDYWLEPVKTPYSRGPDSWPSYYEKSFDGLKNGYRPGTVGPIAGRPTITITRLGPVDDTRPSPGVGLKFGSPLVENETWWAPYALRQVAEVFKELADQIEGEDSSGSP